MNAEQARKITETNFKDAEYCYNQIEASAKSGWHYTNFSDPMTDEVLGVLLKDGYSVKRFIDPYGMEITKVKWI